MRADYDSTANAISITITDATSAGRSDEVHPRAIVALADDQPVEVQLLYPDMGLAEPLAAVAERYDLDRRRSPRPTAWSRSRLPLGRRPDPIGCNLVLALREVGSRRAAKL